MIPLKIDPFTDFDEINIVETQVADIAQLAQKIAENIGEQAEIADNVHENVSCTKGLAVKSQNSRRPKFEFF